MLHRNFSDFHNNFSTVTDILNWQVWIKIVLSLWSTDCPVDVEDLNKLAQTHDPNKEDAVDYPLFITCKKFISKVWNNLPCHIIFQFYRVTVPFPFEFCNVYFFTNTFSGTWLTLKTKNCIAYWFPLEGNFSSEMSYISLSLSLEMVWLC